MKSLGGHEGRFSRDPLPFVFAGGHCQQVRHGQGGSLSDVVHPAFPLPTTVSPTLQGVLKDSFGEAVVACKMSEQCEFPSPNSCQKRFLWACKEVDLASHPAAGPVLHVGKAENFDWSAGFGLKDL